MGSEMCIRDRFITTMKIALINDYGYPLAGAETYFFTLANGLKERGHEVLTVSSDRIRNQETLITDLKLPHSGHCFNLDSFFKPSTYFKLQKYLKNFNPDIVHLNNIFYTLSGAIPYAVRKYKSLITLHDYLPICIRDKTLCDLSLIHISEPTRPY